VAKTRHEAGDIRRGELVTCEFVIENQGMGPLEIASKPACGCTVVTHERVIQPGGQAKIKTELRTAGLRGEFEKTIEVQSNDPARKKFQLVVAGRVVEALEIVPDRTPTMSLRMNGPTELELDVRAAADVVVTGVACSESYARATIAPDGDRSYRLSIIVEEGAPLGRSGFVAMLATTSQQEPQVSIDVSCVKGIEAIPPIFGFTSTQRSGGKVPTSTVVLRKTDGAFRIKSVTSNEPGLSVKALEIKAGLFRLIATYSGAISDLGASGIVTVLTDDPEQPKLEISVRPPARNGPSR
jgi:hypothetical protein